MITAISPIDGRYASKVSELTECFSEYALVRNRVRVEVLWLMALCAEAGIPECRELTSEEANLLMGVVDDFTPQEAEKVKAIEKTTNHDVKAVEYYLKEKIAGTSLEELSEFREFDDVWQDFDHATSGFAHDHAPEQRILSTGQVAKISDLQAEQAGGVAHSVELALIVLVHTGEEPKQRALS